MANEGTTQTDTPVLSEMHQAMSDELDEDIALIRAEIQALSKQRNLLSASLLGSTRIQQQLTQTSSANSLPVDTQALLTTLQNHAQENAYRLALGVTAFPFEGPSAEGMNRRLLGVRFDIANSQGQYDKPYYLLAQRLADTGDELRIHRHTIPAFIPLRRYEETYLSPQDEGYGSGDTRSSRPEKTGLHALVKHIRHDLVSWTLRREAINALREQMRLPARAWNETEEAEPHRDLSVGLFGVRNLTSTAVEALQIKIEWTSGAVGRLKISDKGMIEKAVLIDHRGRNRKAEIILISNPCQILQLRERLEDVFAVLENNEDDDSDEDVDDSEEHEDPGTS